ncbi:MAG: DUF948 domain-containing protein [Gaiellaceae bacterium]
MLLADFGAIDVLWICLSVFLILVGLSLAVMLLRLGGTAQRLTSLLGGVEEKALPLITEVNGTVERVNDQLDKADVVTTSAVDAVSAVDRSVRGVAGAVSWPVRKISSFTTGVKHGAASFRTEGDVSRAYDAGRSAADRRAADIAEELDEEKSSSASVGGSWMQGDEESDPLERARSAGRRRARAEAQDAADEPARPDLES